MKQTVHFQPSAEAPTLVPHKTEATSCSLEIEWHSPRVEVPPDKTTSKTRAVFDAETLDGLAKNREAPDRAGVSASLDRFRKGTASDYSKCDPECEFGSDWRAKRLIRNEAGGSLLNADHIRGMPRRPPHCHLGTVLRRRRRTRRSRSVGLEPPLSSVSERTIGPGRWTGARNIDHAAGTSDAEAPEVRA